MAILRNDWGEPRICPTLGYREVAPDETVTVPDDEVIHWTAAGPWTPVDPAPPVSTPAVAPATSKTAAAAAEQEGTTKP